MLKKILTSVAVVMFAFCMNAGAQELQTPKMSLGKVMPEMSRGMVTSKLDLDPNELWWGYFDGNYANAEGLGVGGNMDIPMAYDAALCIRAGSKISMDKTISGIEFSFPSAKNVADVYIWISETLPDIPQEATICCQKVENYVGFDNPDDGVNQIRFDKPYKIDNSKNIYVGYSFVITADEGQADQYPVFVTGANAECHTEALWVKTEGENGYWFDYQPYKFGDLAVRVLLSGSFDTDGISMPAAFNNVVSVKNEIVSVPLVVKNEGGNLISDFEAVVDINGEKQNIVVTPEGKFEGLSSEYAFDLNFKAPENSGFYPVRITLDKVNGNANSCGSNISEGNLIAVSEKTDHKVVFEEFTGMWCGWCPRGMVGVETAKEKYGDKVLCIVAHIQDALDSHAYYEALYENQPAPSAHLDRKYIAVDPYYGASAKTPFGIGENIDELLGTVPPAKIDISVVADGNSVSVQPELTFLYSGAADYAVGYVMTESGMQDETWIQQNYYSGTDMSADPLLEPLGEANGEMTDVIYNNVVIDAQGVAKGIAGSVPANVEEGKSISLAEQIFNLDDYDIIQDKEKLEFSVILFDRTSGVMLNAASMPMSAVTAINGVEADDENSVEVARYNADGHMISVPAKGVNIVKYSDGSVKKVVVK